MLIASTSTLAQADELFCPFPPSSLKDNYSHLDTMINVCDMICTGLVAMVYMLYIVNLGISLLFLLMSDK